MNKNWPKVSIVIPTLNAAGVITPCFESIISQDYPQDLIEIILSDGGSEDETKELAKKYGAKVVFNELKTAEAGKAVGVRQANGDFIALIDSDNILPNKNWLKQMINPLLKEESAVGSEPWEYTWRKEDSFITRYSALIGMNDPLVHFLGNYDRMNLLTGKWTEVKHDEIDKDDYLLNTFDKRGLPTIGANGTVFKAEFLKENLKGDYLFDIDVLAKYIKDTGGVNFIKVKNGIIHTFCEANIRKFAKKQRRRVKDYLYHKSEDNRDYSWGETNTLGLIRFVFYCVTVIPLLIQSIVGFTRKRDSAWFFHPVACEITLWEYSKGTILGLFRKGEISREGWKQ